MRAFHFFIARPIQGLCTQADIETQEDFRAIDYN
jgi:hypothetical protein